LPPLDAAGGFGTLERVFVPGWSPAVVNREIPLGQKVSSAHTHRANSPRRESASGENNYSVMTLWYALFVAQLLLAPRAAERLFSWNIIFLLLASLFVQLAPLADARQGGAREMGFGANKCS
jgi:hypothetical protein